MMFEGDGEGAAAPMNGDHKDAADEQREPEKSGQGYSAKPETTAGIAGEDEEDSWSTDTLVKYGGWAAAAIVMVSAMMARPS